MITIINDNNYHITETQINEFIVKKFKINPSKMSLSTDFVGQNGYYSSKDIGYYFNTYIFPKNLLRICFSLKKICDYEYCGFRGRLYMLIKRKE
jgi:hypothetical protein